jgi:diacylglycerol kinase family enzyme
MDTGVLGIMSLMVRGATDMQKLVALESIGQVDQFGGWQEWVAPDFEVRSAKPVEIGVDGEALTLQPPLQFGIRPGALTVRLPLGAGMSPAARTVKVASRTTLATLWRVALGRQS